MSFQEQIKNRNVKVKSKKPRIAWLLNDWANNDFREANDLYGGIGYYRVIGPSRELRKWFDIEVVGADFKHWGTTDETYARLGRDYDLIISKHISNGQTGSNILATGKHFNRKVLVDIDDNYLALREENFAIKDYGIGKEGRYFVGAFLGLADGMTVSTEPLKKAYSKINKSIDVLPNCTDIKEWPKERSFKNDGKIRIGFSGGTGHGADLDLLLEPMAYILAKYPNVLFEICSAITPQEAMTMGVKMNEFCKKNITSQFRITGGVEGGVWLGYPELLNSFGWDIIIAPLIDDTFNQGKSHIRWLEASMVGAAVVASPVYPYIEDIQGVKTIEHGKTGYFARNSEDWYQYLEILVRNEKLRKQMAKNAYTYVKNNWQCKHWAKNWRDAINKYL